MKLSSFLVASFTATVYAIDAIALGGDFAITCSNAAGRTGKACLGLQPNQCCNLENQYSVRTVLIDSIPRGWHIKAAAYKGANCNGVMHAKETNTATRLCLGGEYGMTTGWRRARYHFVNKKRSVNSEEGDDDKECEQVQPNAYLLGDGSKYNITGLDPDKLQDLVSCVSSPSSISFRTCLYKRKYSSKRSELL